MKTIADGFGFFIKHPREVCVYALLVLWCSIAFSLALAEISMVAALLFWVYWRYLNGIRRPMIEPAVFIPLLGYVLICLLSLLWTEAPKESYRGIFKVLKYSVLFWMTAEIFSAGTARKKFEMTFGAFFIFLILDGFIQYYFGRDILRAVALQDAGSGPRVSASFKSFGLFASYLISTIPYLAAIGLTYGRPGGIGVLKGERSGRDYRAVFIRWGTGLAVLGGVILLFLTRSRGGFLSFLAGGILWLIFAKKIKWVFLIAVIFTGICYVLPESMVLHRDNQGREQSLVERYYLWDRALSVIKARPVTGTGINTYVAAHAKYDKRQNKQVRDYYAHNGYLQATAETGIPSVLFLFGYLGIYFYRSLARRKMGEGNEDPDRFLRSGLLLGILNFLVMTAVDTVFHNPQAVTVFWFLLGLQYAYLRKAD